EGQVRRVQAALEKAQREGAVAPPPRTPDPLQPVHAPDNRMSQEDSEPVVAAAPDAANYGSNDDGAGAALGEGGGPGPPGLAGAGRGRGALGATEAGELAQAVARQLGFKRTGKRIQARVEACIEGLVRTGVIGRAADQRLQLAPAARAASG